MNILTKYLEQYFDEVDYKEFYRNIFPIGSFLVQFCNNML